jgi:hypothetical protein
MRIDGLKEKDDECIRVDFIACFSQGVFWVGDGRLSTALDVDFFLFLIRRYTYKIIRNL